MCGKSFCLRCAEEEVRSDAAGRKGVLLHPVSGCCDHKGEKGAGMKGGAEGVPVPVSGADRCGKEREEPSSVCVAVFGVRPFFSERRGGDGRVHRAGGGGSVSGGFAGKSRERDCNRRAGREHCGESRFLSVCGCLDRDKAIVEVCRKGLAYGYPFRENGFPNEYTNEAGRRIYRRPAAGNGMFPFTVRLRKHSTPVGGSRCIPVCSGYNP